jgi:hypothetical protein
MPRPLLLLLALCVALAVGACGDGDDPGPSQPDAGMSAGPDAAPPGSIAFMETCDPADDQCDEGLHCFNFNAKGPHCTHACSMDLDCEEPSPGCNNMGVCKAP